MIIKIENAFLKIMEVEHFVLDPYCHQKELVCAIFLAVNVMSVLLEDEISFHSCFS